jgi:uncharacterized membrane protein YjjP (DUF1212 family)
MNAGTFLAAFTALLAVAVVAVIVSQHAQTSAVIQALGSATSSAIGAAVAPVTQSSSG